MNTYIDLRGLFVQVCFFITEKQKQSTIVQFVFDLGTFITCWATKQIIHSIDERRKNIEEFCSLFITVDTIDITVDNTVDELKDQVDELKFTVSELTERLDALETQSKLKVNNLHNGFKSLEKEVWRLS